LFEKAAVRWLGRFALEVGDATLADVRAAADALTQLPTDAEAAMERLAAVCRQHHLPGW
jgi:hypothetical protein